MAVLDKKIQDKIDELSNLSYQLYESHDKEKSYKLMEDAWNLYPEPRENWNESYNTARYALDDLLKDAEIEKALIWYERMCKIHENLKLWEGSFEFYSGKYFFESKNYTKAYEFFKKAVAFRENLDYFNDEDPKYLAFYQNPEKLLKK
jgi:tetratricopeptide (TPR) repeat protein